MDELEFLSALPPPGTPMASVQLPDLAALQMAERLWAFGRVEGEALGVFSPSKSALHRTFKGRLTPVGAAYLATLQPEAPAP